MDGLMRLTGAALRDQWRPVAAALACTVLACGGSSPAMAQQVELPKWEAGASTIGMYAPHYRGADQKSGRAFVLPYLIYRGEWLRADRDGLRAELFDNDDLKFNFSAGLGLPVESDRNQARRGMPQIDWVGEIGPAMDVNLARWNGGRGELDLRLPLRAAFAFDGEPDYVGVVFAPNLRVTLREARWAGGAQVRIATGPLLASADYHRFYYGVAPQFATPARPAYRPKGGYSGWDLSANAVKFFGRWRLFAFAGADLLYGAQFDDSPLIRKRANWYAGGGVAYMFFTSDQRVLSRE